MGEKRQKRSWKNFFPLNIGVGPEGPKPGSDRKTFQG